MPLNNAALDVEKLLPSLDYRNKRRKEAIRLISTLDLLLPLLPGKQLSDDEKSYRCSFLEKLLTEGFLRIFYISDEGQFNIRGRGVLPIVDYVTDALHFGHDTNEQPPRIHPELFDVEQLKKLYGDRSYTSSRNDHNPLWLLLIMIKPIDEQFTLINKIDAYRDVIDLIKKGKFSLGTSFKINQISTLIKQLGDYILNVQKASPSLVTQDVINEYKTLESYLKPLIFTSTKRFQLPFQEILTTLTNELSSFALLKPLKVSPPSSKPPIPPSKSPKFKEYKQSVQELQPRDGNNDPLPGQEGFER